MNDQMQGVIIRALSGFYDVDTGSSVVRCRARGKFRKAGITPLVGDRIRFTPGTISDEHGWIDEILLPHD